MDRHWLLTWTTYATWLPGDERGFVSTVRDGPGARVRHNVAGTPFDADLPGLKRSAQDQMRGPPVYLIGDQAPPLLAQFQETAAHRGWLLLAVAIMSNHVHIVVGVPGDPNPADILRDFKSYGSGALNRRWRKPASGTWWTESGSRRKLSTPEAVARAIRYVRDQEHPLLVWLSPEAQVMCAQYPAGAEACETDELPF